MSLEEYRSCWYQLDGAPAHCTAAVTLELDRIFDDRWMELASEIAGFYTFRFLPMGYS